MMKRALWFLAFIGRRNGANCRNGVALSWWLSGNLECWPRWKDVVT